MRYPSDVSGEPSTSTPAGAAARYDVRSLRRAFDLLDCLAALGGEASLTELATASDLPLPTVHRLVRTLVTAGVARQLRSQRYVLGPRLMRLGDVATRQLGTANLPVLTRLVEATGESANMAVLDRDRAVYVAQAHSRHSMRMFTEPGNRVHLHSTGVGKAMLAALSDAEVAQLVSDVGLPARTPHTITDPDRLAAELVRIRALGYAVDDQEEELGVRCLAVVVPDSDPLTAISVSAPVGRLGAAATEQSVEALQRGAAAISRWWRRG